MSRKREREPLYQTWTHMKERCFNPAARSYRYYGGRGITVCAEWRYSFESFKAAMGPKPSPKHSIGRIDNDGNYEPGNVEWQTPEQQANNNRRNVWLEYKGECLTVAQWANRLGMHAASLAERIKRNLPPEQLFTPKPKTGKASDRVLTLNGRTMNVTEWARAINISPKTIRERLDKNGWSVERALTTPVNPQRQQAAKNRKRTKGLCP